MLDLGVTPMGNPDGSLDVEALIFVTTQVDQLLQQVKKAEELMRGSVHERLPEIKVAQGLGDHTMVRMEPEPFKALVGMATSFQEFANPNNVSPTAAREA